MKLFGTDGIRGRVNEFPITAEVALRMGKAVANVLRSSGPRRNRVLIGKDTRISGYMLETALTSGLVSMGMDVYLVGPMPTPAVPKSFMVIFNVRGEGEVFRGMAPNQD